MSKKKKKKFINDVSFTSLLSDNDRDYLRIIDEKTGEEGEEMEHYDGYIALINGAVVLSSKMEKRFYFLADKICQPEHINNTSLKKEFEELVYKNGKCTDSLTEDVISIYEYCEKTNRFWHNSSLKVYELYYPNLLEAYLEKFKNSEELDFLKFEYEYYLKINTKNRKNNTIYSSGIDRDDMLFIGYFQFLNQDEKEFFNINTSKKLDFISSKILELGYYIQFSKEKKEVYLNLIPVKNEKSDFDKLDEEVIDKSNLPSFSLLERYALIKRFGINKLVTDSKTLKKEKNKLLALIMDCSIDNARKLLDNTYKLKDKEKNKVRETLIEEKIDEFLFRNKIDIDSIK
ncbi:hypothetical protein EC396_00810 [Lutibacter sp. HS1-25]|uniref:hypothetical protein n=1 Tax=Lutibacter sp. HS1-25 TaxID=2485000 RepID=UPI001010764A|nr:hypothetical protein [Lutibacter sp. HS1-25]RXP64548.1 hypothetical protein EC396_00810 [Lutibacter sp. HS1-25]